MTPRVIAPTTEDPNTGSSVAGATRNGRERPPGGRLGARLLLLVLLVLTGVFGMHTLGHPTSGSHCDVVDAAAAHEIGGSMPFMAGPASYALTAPHDDGGTGVVLHPLEVCLAVLTAALLLVLAVLLAASQRRQGLADARFHPGLAAAGRAPPEAVVFGLRVADLSVMRN